jgi:Ca-activated chloride channel family protein
MNADNHDYPDAILDRGLAELVGGETPPDLSERILAAAQTTVEPITLAEGTATMSTVKQSSRLKSWTILAASIACVATVIGLSNAARRLSDQNIVAKMEFERSPKSHSGSTTDNDQLMMTVTPHIIIQEGEEEEQLGIATEESGPVDLPRFETSTVTDSTSVPDGGTILLGGLKPKLSSEGAGLQSKESINLESVLESARRAERRGRGREQESFEKGLAKSASTGTKFGIRPNLESASEPTSGSPILSKVPNAAEEEDEFYEISLGFPTGRYARKSALGLDGLINDGYSVEFGTGPGTSGDQYTRIYENPFITAQGGDAVSTFSIDVDTASYANVRQFLTSGQLPPPDAVRIEELVNYFPYNYEGPQDDTPFAAHMEVAACPWNPAHRLARIAIKGREIDRKVRPQSNLVFLIDVSGSMNEPNKLPLLVDGMKLLVRELGENDKVAIVVYASSEGMALPSTRGDQQQTILAALDNLRAGGSTAGGAGINLAYQVAQENFITGGVNRVILCTDGDFNVGVTDTAALTRLAEQKAKDTKVFLTVLGFGRGNLNDAMMEAISGKGNGNYHYVDNLTEARKVLVEEMSGTLVTIAKDVKIQVEFNPAQVAGYRLIGYENRMLRTEDFNDDKKDAGEIGAGHTVTALYEIVPAGETVGTPSVDPLKYQPESPSPQSSEEAITQRSSGPASTELLTLKLRYKLPDADTSTKVEFPITDSSGSFADASDDFQFAAAVASFGMLLRNSEYKGNATFDSVLEMAQSALGEDPHGYRGEFLELIRGAKNLKQ